MTRRLLLPAAAVLSLAAALAGCGSDSSSSDASGSAAAGSGASGAAGDCAPDSLQTTTSGTLTWGTSEPAYEPWVVDNDPTTGKGYESAVAAAVTKQLGFTADKTTWVRGTFDTIIAPGPKDFDIALNQVSITDERKGAVDFSSSYYDVRQAVVTVAGSPAASAKTLADLKGVKLGAQVGTTSLDAIKTSIAPTTEAAAFNSNDDVKLALANGQVDAIVVDLPTAYYLTSVEIEGGTIVGTLPQAGGTPEQYGLVLDLGSPLTQCVTQAVDALRADGTLDSLEAEWLSNASAPELS